MQIKLFVCTQFMMLKMNYERNIRKDLLGTISFKFCTVSSRLSRLVSNKFSSPNIGTTDYAVFSLMTYVNKWALFKMWPANIFFLTHPSCPKR